MGRQGLGSEQGRERGARESGGAGGTTQCPGGYPCSWSPAPPGARMSVRSVAGLRSRLQLPLRCWWGEPTPLGCCSPQLCTHASAPSSGSQSLHRHCWVQSTCLTPSSSTLSSHRPSQFPLSLSIVPSLSYPTFSPPTPFFFCLFFSAFYLFAYNLAFPIFSRSQAILLAFHQLPDSHLSPGFCPFSSHPLPQTQLSTPARGCVFLLHAL